MVTAAVFCGCNHLGVDEMKKLLWVIRGLIFGRIEHEPGSLAECPFCQEMKSKLASGER